MVFPAQDYVIEILHIFTVATVQPNRVCPMDTLYDRRSVFTGGCKLGNHLVQGFQRGRYLQDEGDFVP
jgi:hypothetical protein